MLYVFVEGPDDHNYFDKIFGELWGNYQVVEYSHLPHSKTNNFLKSINAMSDSDYLFFCDEDRKGKENKRTQMLTRYRNLDANKLFIIQVEIESWYYAGVSQENCQRLKLRNYQEDTNTLTKEQFNSKLWRPSDRKYIMAQMLECYEKALAKTRNSTYYSFSSSLEREPAAVS